MQEPSEQALGQSPGAQQRHPGPRVVRLYGTVIAVLWVAAWWSWGIQAQALVGCHGLLPLAEFFARSHRLETPGVVSAPSIFWLAPTDWAILVALALGIVSATLAAFDIAPKRSLILCMLLYVSFMAPAAPFFPMLADRLLLEATALMLLLPRNRPGAAVQWLARGLIFKLYCEIGLAQWLAPDNAWQHGLALRSFLETTPLPTLLGFWAAHLPDGCLMLATKCVVFVLLFAPWLVFGPRPLRLVAAVSLTALQLCVALLCNYGLFCWVAVALHLFLVSDDDVARLQADIHRVSPTLAGFFGRLTHVWQAWRPWGRWAPIVLRLKTRHPVAAPALHRGLRGTAAMVLAGTYLMGSLVALLPHVGLWAPPAAWQPRLAQLRAVVGPWHVVNTYASLHAPISSRNEPVLEALVNNSWQPLHLWHQPSDLWAKPKLVAPHQPRLDVQLSSFGRGGTLTPLPRFVGRLMETLCDEPQAVARLFATPLPPHPQAVRISLWQYSFASWDTVRDRGAYWERKKTQDGPHLVCGSPTPQ